MVKEISKKLFFVTTLLSLLNATTIFCVRKTLLQNAIPFLRQFSSTYPFPEILTPKDLADHFTQLENDKLFVFVGPPASGKGSVAKICLSQPGWAHLSTGDLSREHIANRTLISKQIESAVTSGRLVDDEIIVAMVTQGLEASFLSNRAVILDGFPRTEYQAEQLGQILTERLPLTGVSIIQFLASDDTVIQQGMNRAVCSNYECGKSHLLIENSSLAPSIYMTCNDCRSPLLRRENDDENLLRKRLEEYRQYEQSVLNFFERESHDVNQTTINFGIDAPLDESLDIFRAIIESVDGEQ
ncbi:adenylate kinase family protein [Candidatus Dependentiae bacterium]